jgi:acyl carrier protein
MEATKKQIREMLATRLKLGAAMEKLGDDTPLFGPEGFGLDSIDALELVLGLQKEFGVVIEDRQLAVKVLASIDSIAAYITAQAKA